MVNGSKGQWVIIIIKFARGYWNLHPCSIQGCNFIITSTRCCGLCRVAEHWPNPLVCKAERQHLLICKVRRYCFLTLHANPCLLSLNGATTSKLQSNLKVIQKLDEKLRCLKTGHVLTMMVQCWVDVFDVGPTLYQHWFRVPCQTAIYLPWRWVASGYSVPVTGVLSSLAIIFRTKYRDTRVIFCRTVQQIYSSYIIPESYLIDQCPEGGGGA